MRDEASGTGAPELTGRQTRMVLGVVALALMSVVSAVTGLNVALPDMARETGASQTQLTWIVDAYTVVFAGLLFFAGALGDRYGRRRVLLVGLVLFGIAGGAGPGHERPRPADRRPGVHGHRGGRHHAHDPLDHHDLVPRG